MVDKGCLHKIDSQFLGTGLRVDGRGQQVAADGAGLFDRGHTQAAGTLGGVLACVIRDTGAVGDLDHASGSCAKILLRQRIGREIAPVHLLHHRVVEQLRSHACHIEGGELWSSEQVQRMNNLASGGQLAWGDGDKKMRHGASRWW